MSKYARKTSRSRRKPSRRIESTTAQVITTDDGGLTMQLMLPFDPVLALEDALDQLVGDVGVIAVAGLLEDEAEQLAGPKHAKRDGKGAKRHGYEEGSVVIGGMKRSIQRPRLREDGKEVDLVRYRLFNASRRIRKSVQRRILSRISTRHYEGIVDDLAEGHGIRKSSVSRHWKAVSQQELAKLMDRPLGDLDLTAIMIDGVGIKDTTIIAALGYATDGTKHLLGLWGGATENSTVVKGLLADLVRRGLDPAKSRLFVLDGSKALAKGVRDTFGDKAIIQRCQVHKLRNVLDHLPAKYHAMARMRIRAAWGMDAYEEAREALEQTADWLETLSSYAAGSLREGMEETITLHRLGLPAALRTTFRSTNPIENIFSTFRDRSRNVRNWSSSPDMPLRWTAAVLLDAEGRFHRCRHFKLLPALVNALATGVSVANGVA